MKLVITVFGSLLAYSPTIIPKTLCTIIGTLIYYLPTKRRLTLLSNLHHAFPDRDFSILKDIGRTSCIRMVETALYVIAFPYFSESRLRNSIRLTDEMMEISKKTLDSDTPTILAIPHLTLMESTSLLPWLLESDIEFGAIYRPFKNPNIENWVKETRERFKVKMLSRKSGFNAAMQILRKGGNVGILFDQNAGNHGALSFFMDRVCSTSDLTGLLAKKFNTAVIATYPQRTGFWKADLHAEIIDAPKTPADITIALNRWLENLLRTNESACENWLWSHARWRNQDSPDKRFRLEQKKSYIEESKTAYSWSEIPKKTRIWIRIPNWLGDVVMALPIIRAIQKGRPDAEITIITKSAYTPLLTQLKIADNIIELPQKGSGYFRKLLPYRKEYPDIHLLFTNSSRGDMEAKVIKAPQRFGMLRPGKNRPFLTHAWNLPDDLDESKNHQTLVWEKFARHFGLKEDLELEPANISTPDGNNGNAIGMICGTENDPSKRWPVESWRELIRLLLENKRYDKVILFGTPNDKKITDQVADGYNDFVDNIAGKTNITEFAEKLKSCKAIVCNDTGGMHLANAIGVPVFGIFGPTNPVRTGPIFDAKKVIIQAEGCPETGGMPIEKIKAEHVLSCL